MNLTMAITPIVYILVEALKKTEKVPKNWLPYAALLLGTVAGIVLAVVDKPNAVYYIVTGFMNGAAAAGIYDAIATGKPSNL